MKRLLTLFIPILLSPACHRTNDSFDAEFLNDEETANVDTIKHEPVPPVGSAENTQLRTELDLIFKSDQSIRNDFQVFEQRYGRNSDELLKLYDEMQIIDQINSVKVTRILDKYGWIGTDKIGEQGNATLFLVIQHSDLSTQDKYLPIMRRAVKENAADAGSLALLIDRVRLGHGKKQLYGSQIDQDQQTGNYRLFPIEDEPNVNKRRASMGLPPLEQYAKNWDINYLLPPE
jgi:hypothetical protein